MINTSLGSHQLACDHKPPVLQTATAPYLIRFEGLSYFLYKRLVGGVVSGGVKDKHKVEDESISLILLIIDAFWTTHHPIASHITVRKGDQEHMNTLYTIA